MTQETKQEQIPQEETTELAEAPQEVQTTQIPAETPAETEAPVEEAKVQRKKKETEQVVEERFYTIPLQKALIRPPKKRAPRAMSLIKIFVTKHMKLNLKVSEEEEEEELPQLIISPEVNEAVWGRGIEKPPRKIKVRVTKDSDGNVSVFLVEKQ